MKIQYTRFEKITGLFLLGAFCGGFVLLAMSAWKQGWFEQKYYFHTFFETGEGVREGTPVQISGLQAGEVSQVVLTQDNRIRVEFYVNENFRDKIRKDSQAQLLRPFVIGEKNLDITMGSQQSSILEEGQAVGSKESLDLLSLFGGRNLQESLQAMSGMVSSLRRLAEAFLNEERTESFIAMFDRLDPLLKNMNKMSIELIKLAQSANRDERLGTLLQELAQASKELNVILPELNQQAPSMAKDMGELVKNLNELTTQFKVLTPAFAEVAPELPRASRRAIEALDEAVILMKAMQKSFFVRSHVDTVKEEEARRKPAETPKETEP